MTAHDEAVQRHARVLKAMLWGMGLLMAAAAVVVAAMIVKAVNPPSAEAFAASLTLEPGCKVDGIASAGARLAIRIGGGAGCDRILIADPETGKIVGTLKIENQ